MAVKLRSFFLVVLAVAATVVIAMVPGVAPQVALLATTAIIMGGAGHPLGTPPDDPAFVDAYTANRLANYVNQSGFTGPSGTPPDNTLVVITPEHRILGFGFDPSFTFRGIFDGPFDQAVSDGQKNLDSCLNGDPNCAYNQDASTGTPTTDDTFIIYGYSQSSTVATLEKNHLIEQYPNGGGPDARFVLTANGNRPNGGILTRGPAGLTVPIIGLTFGNPTRTDSYQNEYQTDDVARQYDGWADQPLNPLNPFAELNSWLGQVFLHVNYDDVDMNDAVVQDQVGDTTYYLIPTEVVPLLIPLESVPVIGHSLAVTADPFVRVFVESGYDRTISPGAPTEYNLLYFPNPVDLAHNLVLAIPTGWDNGIADVTGDTNNRPFGTEVPGPYGVGGPPVNIADQQSQLLASPPESGEPVTTGAADLDPTTQAVRPKRPFLTALNAATQVQAQGEVRKNPLAIPNGSAMLLQGASGAGNGGVTGSAAGIGAPLKQLGQAVKDAVDNVLKPKVAASGDAPSE